MSRGVRFSLRSVDALCAFQALTCHSSLDEGIFAETTRNPEAITDIRSGVGGKEDAGKQKDIG
jgi:hypothetical protein